MTKLWGLFSFRGKIQKWNAAAELPLFKLIDLFCGTGGFAHGFLTSNDDYKLVYAIDSDPWASETARANHTKTRVDTKDIRSIDTKTLKADLGVSSVDVIIGGPPCQGFSSLRPNRSSNNEDERNSLFLNYAKFIREFRPKVFVLENVVGLVTHDEGRTLELIMETFTKLGYAVDWKLLNAASFGVPQKRERFILMGARDNGPIQFPSPKYSFKGKVIGHKDKTRLLLGEEALPLAVSVNEAIDDLPSLERGQEKTKYTNQPATAYQKQMRGKNSILTMHKASNHSDKLLKIIKHAGDSISSIPPHLITSGFSSCYSRLNGEEPATTITVKFQSPASSKCIHPYQHRTITPREAARIQSFDDAYIFKGSLTQVANQLGNAVPPLLGKAISKSVSKLLRQA